MRADEPVGAELEPPLQQAEELAPPPAPADSPSALSRYSAARLIADGAGLVLGVIAAVITARWLGPSGKGVFAALTFTAALCGRAASLGLGEAGIVMVGKRVITMREAFRANLAGVLITAVPAAIVFAAVAVLQIQPDSRSLWLAILVVAVTVPLFAIQDVLGHGLTMQERIVAASLLVLLMAAATLCGLVAFVILWDLDIVGAALGSLLGFVAGILAGSVLLLSDFDLRPRWAPRYLRGAAAYGLRLQGSYLLTLLVGRVDLLIVFALAGSAAAGNYSVALTIAAVVGLAPFAVSFATFPRIAYEEPDTAAELTALVTRRGLAASILTGVVLAALTPILVPVLFGEPFQPAVVPALLLMIAATAGGVQWIIARAAASRGNARILMISFALSLVVMVALDFLLIPPLDLTGAALAFIVASLAGLLFCVVWVRSQGSVPIRLLVARPDDFRAVFALGIAVARRPLRVLRP